MGETNMKKCLSFLLIVSLLLSFSACSDNSQKLNCDTTNINNAQNTAEEMYEDFIAGKSTAVYADGTSIDIDYLSERVNAHPLRYALLDRNGDSVPELCIDGELFVTTFWVSDGTLKLWREENYGSKILRNGNSLQKHYGGAPNHTDYSYVIYSYTGEVACQVTLSVLTENGVDLLENMYTQCVYVENGSDQEAPATIEISREQFDKALASIEKIGEAKLSWKDILL